jgi:hypothetical protein
MAMRGWEELGRPARKVQGTALGIKLSDQSGWDWRGERVKSKRQAMLEIVTPSSCDNPLLSVSRNTCHYIVEAALVCIEDAGATTRAQK